MKCPKCGGSGWDVVHGFDCISCDGKGEIDLTNEEWFGTLSTKEKAKWLSRHSQFMYECGQKQVAPKIMYEEDWEWWLKEKHE